MTGSWNTRWDCRLVLSHNLCIYGGARDSTRTAMHVQSLPSSCEDSAGADVLKGVNSLIRPAPAAGFQVPAFDQPGQQRALDTSCAIQNPACWTQLLYTRLVTMRFAEGPHNHTCFIQAATVSQFRCRLSPCPQSLYCDRRSSPCMQL